MNCLTAYAATSHGRYRGLRGSILPATGITAVSRHRFGRILSSLTNASWAGSGHEVRLAGVVSLVCGSTAFLCMSTVPLPLPAGLQHSHVPIPANSWWSTGRNKCLTALPLRMEPRTTVPHAAA